jgi:hypothetical protein
LEASLGKLEATDLEPNWEESEAMMEHQEVPNDEATLENIGALRDSSSVRDTGTH